MLIIVGILSGCFGFTLGMLVGSRLERKASSQDKLRDLARFGAVVGEIIKQSATQSACDTAQADILRRQADIQLNALEKAFEAPEETPLLKPPPEMVHITRPDGTQDTVDLHELLDNGEYEIVM